jgi:Protein of unknown function (DUF2905)
MAETGKMLVMLGAILLVAGGMVWVLGRSGFRSLPGDIAYQRGHFGFYFPIVTCIVLSIVFTLAMWLWQWLGRK